ncbi:hypothetical protein [Streptomyces sp. NPDC087859]|uniref:hypothetical protein n=1 Tax=Streptomyces sp. NPDC087859 TaxID=3365812 RepID=UPI00381ACDC9
MRRPDEVRDPAALDPPNQAVRQEEIEGALALMTALTETVQQAKAFRSEVAFSAGAVRLRPGPAPRGTGNEGSGLPRARPPRPWRELPDHRGDHDPGAADPAGTC